MQSFKVERKIISKSFLPGIDEKDSNGKTALEIAVENKNLDQVKKLLYDGANPDFAMTYDLWSLSVISGSKEEKRRKIEILKLLISYGANCNKSISMYGTPPLHLIAIKSDENDVAAEVVRILLHHGANINATDSLGSTPLHYAAQFGSEEMCRLLLQLGADRAMRNRKGKTALDVAKESFWIKDESKRRRFIELLQN